MNSSPARDLVWPWRLLAFSLILGTAALRIFYFAYSCPLDLAPDEAHYWDWSRNLDWSYYSKGPLVAYLIRAGCLFAGSWSQQVLSNEMLAVRLPAVLCGSLLLVSMYVLTVQVFGREKLAAFVVMLALTLPMVAAGSSIMTIDSPYTCCWGWALVLAYQAVTRGWSWCWPAAGLVIGIGILAKYTMVLFVPSLALFLLFAPAYRHLLFRPGFWVLSLVAAACCLPILFWNVEHDWVSYRHVSGLAGIHDRGGIRWLGPLKYTGMQFGLLLGYWFVVWATAMVANRPWKQTDDGRRYLWWLSAPMFLVFFGFSLKTEEEPNWPVTAYLSGIVLAAAWIAEQLQSPRVLYRRMTFTCLSVFCTLGVALTVIVHHTDWFQPMMVKLSGPVTRDHPMPLRRFDPTCRLRGWRALAAAIDRVRRRLEEQGTEPILAASSWWLPGEIGFYCEGHPQVFSMGLALGDRWSQYDLWRPNPVLDAAVYEGKTFIFIGEANPRLYEAFEQVEPPQSVVYRENGQPIASWTITVCKGFRGFAGIGDSKRF